MEDRNKSIDLLKRLAVIGVIAIHAQTLKGMGGSFQVLYTIIETLARTSVPIFFFFNGYYFYKGYIKKEGLYYKNFCIKILKMHIFVGIIYKIFIIIENFINNRNFDMNVFAINKLLAEFVYRGFYFHLWYLPVAIILITLLYLFIKLKKVEILFCISIIIYIFGVLCSEHFFDNIINKNIIKYSENGISLGMVFVILGYLYSKNKNSINKYFKFKGFFLIILLLIERLCVYLFTGSKEVITMYFMLIPTTYYLVDYFINKNIEIKNRFILKYTKESTGIYLYHYIGIMIIWEIFRYIEINPKNISYHIIILPGSYMLAYYINNILEKIVNSANMELKRIKSMLIKK